jgi:hypothetical protein
MLTSVDGLPFDILQRKIHQLSLIKQKRQKMKFHAILEDNLRMFLKLEKIKK